MKVLLSIKLSATLMTELPSAAEQQLLHSLSVTIRPVTRAITEVLVLWKTPIIGWLKANTDGSVTSVSAVSGGLFRDYMANFRGGFAQKITGLSVLHAELMALILAMESGIIYGWRVTH
ncbi:hypothetical protein L195_g000078 [Trifolium pratense]|uniref:Uncharacterized protein n=1 Tax=Trifolium pratense TaxID=57577 RepID=A0A2K3NKV9_TRIPR|nr:hypothetical protein L195_g000078 [Trifolium pratense]